ncbi:HD domain-containing protein, partial [bacterium]|nr:HD domain-containing protein [bacterium]
QYLMIFFLLGYLTILGAYILDITFLDRLFIGLILFLGAVFVLLGINLQSTMLISIRGNFLRAIKMLVATVEVRDPYTIGHSEHVANLSVLIFDHLPDNLKKDCNRNTLETTGLLHDIGKIGVPESILNKPGRLSDEEFEFIKQHVSIGRNILKKLEDFGAITDWILYHHERVDGKGYLKMSNEEIPTASKIISVADTYSAIVTDRPYRKGKTNTDAKSILSEFSGTQFDPEIVRVFLDIDDERIEKCRPEALVLEYLEELQRIENKTISFDNTSDFNKELSREVGILYMKKMIDFSKKQKIPLSITCINITERKSIEEKHGYHEIDELSAIIADILLNSIRTTDILIRFDRDKFILVFPKCLINEAMKFTTRILETIESHESIKAKNYKIELCKDFIGYDPDDETTFDIVNRFYEKMNLKINTVDSEIKLD